MREAIQGYPGGIRALAGDAQVSRSWVYDLLSGKNVRLDETVRFVEALRANLPQAFVLDLWELVEGTRERREAPKT